jgi:hypothetical protein
MDDPGHQADATERHREAESVDVRGRAEAGERPGDGLDQRLQDDFEDAFEAADQHSEAGERDGIQVDAPGDDHRSDHLTRSTHDSLVPCQP